jgi:hypothetical protein
MKLVLHGHYKGKTVKLRDVQFTNGVAEIPGHYVQNEGICIYMARCYQAFPEGMTFEEGVQYASKVPASALGDPPKEIPGAGEPPGPGSKAQGSAQQPGNGGATGGGASDLPEGGGYGDPRLHTRLQEALNSLDPKNEAHWTKTGAPALMAVENMLGGGHVTRKEIETAIPGFNREVAAGKPLNLEEEPSNKGE